MSPWALNRLSAAVDQGAVFASPTDTVWGFGCHPLSYPAVSQILNIKHRPKSKGLILLSSRLDYCLPYLQPSELLQRIEKTEPQPTTWLVEASRECPHWLRGNFTTVAVRICDHPFVSDLCERLKSPVVSTSANRAGKSTARNSFVIRKQFASELDYIINGYETGGNKPSEIRYLATGKSIRGGN